MTPEEQAQLENLSNSLLEAKGEEEWAKRERIEIEEQIAALIPGPERGSKTVTLPDGTKLTVERGWNYTADCNEIEHQCNLHGIANVPIKVKTTRELDSTGYHWYEQNDARAFSIISKLVTVKPKKVAIRIQDKK